MNAIEAEVRRKLVQTGDVDVMVAIRPNFFYTRTVPANCGSTTAASCCRGRAPC